MRRLFSNCGKTFAGLLLGSSLVLGTGCATDDSLDVLHPRVPTTPDKVDDNDDDDGADFFIPEDAVGPSDLGLTFQRLAKDPGDHPRAFVAVGGNIYWTANIDEYHQAIFASNFDTRAANVVIAKVNVEDLAGNEDGLWWVDPGLGQVVVMRNGDSFAAPVFDLPELATSIALQGDMVYVGGADGHIFAASQVDGTFAPIAEGAGVPMDLQIANGKLYWSTSTKLGDNLYAYDFKSGETTELLSRFDLSAGFVVDADLLAWADSSMRAVLGVDPNGGEPFVLSEDHFGLSGIAMDRGSIYVTSMSENSVRFVPRQGGDSRLIGVNLDAPANPVLIDGHIILETDEGAFVAAQ